MTRSTPTECRTHSKVFPVPGEVIDSGVDWITFTMAPGGVSKALQRTTDTLFHLQHRAGWDVKRWAWNGYFGIASEHLAFGERWDSVIVRASGVLASLAWLRLYWRESRCTRCDVQTTVRMSSPDVTLLTRLRKHALGYRSGRGRPATPGFRGRGDLEETITFGNRQSQWFLRAYDKGRERKQGIAGTTIRYEAEAHDVAARSLVRQLYLDPIPTARASSIVTDRFLRRGIQVPSISKGTGWIQPLEMGSTTESRLRYLRTVVKPMLRRLIDDGHGVAALRELGLPLPSYILATLQHDDDPDKES